MAETRGKARMDAAAHHGNKKQKIETVSARNLAKAEAAMHEDVESFEDFLKLMENSLSLDEAQAMLDLNEQDSKYGTDDEIFRRCADQMFYGPMDRCVLCGGGMEFNGSEFRCLGFFSEWTKCDYTTKEDRTKQEEWKIPEGTKNNFLKQWKKNQERRRRPKRNVPAEQKFFDGMRIALQGRLTRTQPEYKREIEKYGGKIVSNLKEGVTCVVIPDDELSLGGSSKLLEAMEKNVRVVKEAWLRECLAKKQRLPFDDYDVSTVLPGESAVEDTEDMLMAEIKLAGKRDVHKDSRLKAGAHIYERDGIIYNCAFAVCDFFASLNHYAILQLIELDDGTIYIYHKRGRGGDRLDVHERLEEQQSVEQGIEEFSNIFEDLTGNEFEPWERHKAFSKKRLKFFPIDMNIGYDACAGALHFRQVAVCAAHTKLDPHVAEVCKLIFSQESYRFALSEYGHLIPDLPLGNLTEFHIHRCEEILHGFAKYLKESKDEGIKRDITCVDKSNRWYSLLYSIRPLVFTDIVELAELAAPALECVRDISIASQLIGNMTEETSLDDPFDDSHIPLLSNMCMKLIVLISHQRTNAVKRFFYGVFGRGIYCSDASSEAAQYGFTSIDKPDGFLMLAVVSLGDRVLELTKPKKDVSEYEKERVDIKALGKRKPDESEFTTWRDNIIVPCGSLTDSGVKDPFLDNNEYVVYDPRQVKLTYLVSVRYDEIGV
ncbi:hypothetical protein O6H91_07G034900 [Diphasiastrum complanatum]|uniref:Uncharacterized protein n=1 Tax=Diphasiastrum complanatum TaxID=34168 RepID=A0ACC2D470_DIPCM|nr:hypothetical protein O6H91_07G034900 [Diphasiastrum complanatum]